VSRDEFAALEKRVSLLEAKLNKLKRFKNHKPKTPILRRFWFFPDHKGLWTRKKKKN